jgi:hypothetical protein
MQTSVEEIEGAIAENIMCQTRNRHQKHMETEYHWGICALKEETWKRFYLQNIQTLIAHVLGIII